MRLLKVSAQLLSIVLVASLLGLLIWKVVESDRGGVAAEARRGKIPPAPNFTLPRLDRASELELASLRGQVVVLNFWASWCRPCKQEAPQLEQTWRRWRDRDVVVVGVNIQDFAGDARRFARRYGMTYPLVRDGKGSTLGRYGVAKLPETFVIGRDGKLVAPPVQGAVTAEQLEEHIQLAFDRA